MSFFVGSKKTGLGKHDDEARKIAARGTAFVEAHWRKRVDSLFPFLFLLRNPAC
jgi:hypothetical protein